MTRRVRALLFVTALAGSLATCSSGYDVGDGPGGVPDPANPLAGGPTGPGAGDVSVANPDGGALAAAECLTDEECVEIAELLGPCEVARCDAERGECAAGPAADALPCDDGDLCTTDTLCPGGICGGLPVNCADENVCTDDLCDLELG